MAGAVCCHVEIFVSAILPNSTHFAPEVEAIFFFFQARNDVFRYSVNYTEGKVDNVLHVKVLLCQLSHPQEEDGGLPHHYNFFCS